MKKEFQSGALLDTRPEKAKLKDYKFEEIVSAAAPVDWVEKPESKWREFLDQNQDGSGSCVMQTIRKLAGILLYLKEGQYVEFSAGFYGLRSNRPASGMMGVEAFDIWMKQGLPLEALVESDNMNDAQMDAIKVEQYEKDIAKIFAIGGHVGISNGDFDTTASVIQTTKKGVMAWFYFTAEEWSKRIPTVISSNLNLATALRHSVAAIDCFKFDGVEYILIEDSAHFGGITRRLITREFFEQRNFFLRYPMNFKFEATVEPSLKPKYTFSAPLEFGTTNNDVKALQDILKYEGFFPINADSTGYYGAVTATGVLKWQIAHDVAPLAELNQLAGRRVGSKTLAKLNSLYN